MLIKRHRSSFIAICMALLLLLSPFSSAALADEEALAPGESVVEQNVLPASDSGQADSQDQAQDNQNVESAESGNQEVDNNNTQSGDIQNQDNAGPTGPSEGEAASTTDLSEESEQTQNQTGNDSLPTSDGDQAETASDPDQNMEQVQAENQETQDLTNSDTNVIPNDSDQNIEQTPTEEEDTQNQANTETDTTPAVLDPDLDQDEIQVLENTVVTETNETDTTPVVSPNLTQNQPKGQESTLTTETIITQPQTKVPEVLPTLPPVLPSKIIVAGNVTDGTVTMGAGCMNVLAGDNTWEINLTSGTLKGLPGDDLTVDFNVTGLPEGLTWTAQNGGGNNVLITVTGPANSFVTDQAAVSITVKGSAVSEVEAVDSNVISLSVNLNGPQTDVIAIDQASNTIYAASRDRNEVTVVDGATNIIKCIIKGGADSEAGTGNSSPNDFYIAKALLAS